MTGTRSAPATAHAGPVAAALRSEVWDAVREEDRAGARAVLDYFLEEAAHESSISGAAIFRRAAVRLRKDAGYLDRLLSALSAEHGEDLEEVQVEERDAVRAAGRRPAAAARRTRRGRGRGRRTASAGRGAAEPLGGGNVIEVDFRRRRRGAGGAAGSPASASL